MAQLKDGKYTVRFRQELREFLEAKPKLVTYINDLVKADKEAS